MEQSAPPSAGFYNFLGWLDVNKKRVAIGAAVVVVIGLVAALLIWRNSEQDNEAALALSAVRVPFNPTEAAPPGTAEAFLKVAEQYPSTPSAPQAVLRAATVYFANGQYPQAVEQFNRFLGKYGDTPWVPQARYGIAASLDAQGNAQEAINRYNEFIRTYPSDPAVDEARFNVARLYEKANQPAQAIEVLSRMTNAGPFTATGAEVQERLKSIYKQHPELAPKPVATPTPGRGNDVPLMLQNVPRAPQPNTPAPTVTPTPAPATPGAPNAPGTPAIKLQPPQQTPQTKPAGQ
jgi:tetratricopeptide (TPR) repeat protein